MLLKDETYFQYQKALNVEQFYTLCLKSKFYYAFCNQRQSLKGHLLLGQWCLGNKGPYQKAALKRG